MDPLISLELRWFFDRGMPPAVKKWFEEQLPDTEISPVDARNDIYLFTREHDDFGTKLREGRLEIKWRQFAQPFEGAHGVAGQMERWVKWWWEDQKGAGPDDVKSWADPTGPWVTVAKERRQRKYRWDNSKYVPAPAKPILELGAAIEATILKFNRHEYGTILIETFAPQKELQQKLLHAAVKYLWLNYPRPMPGVAQSYGYPHWLATINQK